MPIYGKFIYLCVVLRHPFGGERGGEDREAWLAVVILRSSFTKTDVHLPRRIHTGEFTTCFICPLDIYSDDAHSTLSHHHVYMCSDYQWSILLCTYLLSIHMFYVYSLSCWNRTSVHTESFVATFSLRLHYLGTSFKTKKKKKWSMLPFWQHFNSDSY